MKAEPEPQRRVAKEQVSSQWEEREARQLQQQAGDSPALEPLFTLMAQFHQHPELIPVARDFIRELAPDEYGEVFLFVETSPMDTTLTIWLRTSIARFAILLGIFIACALVRSSARAQ